MKILVAGASGATGRLLTAELLRRGCRVVAIVRSSDALPDFSSFREQLTIVRAAILDLSDVELAQYVQGCDAPALQRDSRKSCRNAHEICAHEYGGKS
jgi:putative NADH-flavin reductase